MCIFASETIYFIINNHLKIFSYGEKSSSNDVVCIVSNDVFQKVCHVQGSCTPLGVLVVCYSELHSQYRYVVSLLMET